MRSGTRPMAPPCGVELTSAFPLDVCSSPATEACSRASSISEAVASEILDEDAEEAGDDGAACDGGNTYGETVLNRRVLINGGPGGGG